MKNENDEDCEDDDDDDDIFREPEKPKPIVINRYADEMLREVAQRMTFRNNIYKEKVLDPYASSPEYSPAVSECPHTFTPKYTRCTIPTVCMRY